MKKNLGIMAFIMTFYAIPLMGTPESILHPKIIILMIACWTLFITQPALSIKEADEKKQSDRYSIFAIMIAATASQIAAVVDWGYFQAHPPDAIVTAIGFIMLISGSAFRIWSIRVLGRFFTATVQVQDGQRIVSSGPYRIVRHPSYLGAYIAIVGSTIFLGSLIGFVVAVMGMGIAYKLRIDAEEETLIRAFGEEYTGYQQQTNRMIPFVW